MLVKRFLTWIQTAPAQARAEATASLARAWLGADLNAVEKVDAAAALTLMLDDPDLGVRQALAGVFADLEEAPRHIVFALASDHPAVAVPVIRRSPLLADSDLVEWAATRGPHIQCAIAARRPLSAPVAAALAEVAEDQALVVLAGNLEARIPAFSLARMAERFGDDPQLARILLARDDLDPMARFFLLSARHGGGAEAGERAAACVACGLEDDDLADFVAHLRRRALLTPSLLLRAAVSGELVLFEAVIAELAHLPRRRVSAIVAEWRGSGLAALCRKVELPPALVPVLRCALAAAAEIRDREHDGFHSQPARSVIVARLLQSDALSRLDEAHPIRRAVLRLADEAARDEARRVALALAPPAEEALRQETLQEEPLLLEQGMVVAGPPAPAVAQDNQPAALPAPDTGDAAAVAPSYGAMAALLEETVAAALANLPPPQPREERFGYRRAVVIEGEWVGVAVETDFDPGQFRADVAA